MEKYIKGFKGFMPVKICGLSPLTSFYAPLPIISLLVKHLESYSGRPEQSRVVCLITGIFKNAIVLTDYKNLEHRQTFLDTCTPRKLAQMQVTQFLELTRHVNYD